MSRSAIEMDRPRLDDAARLLRRAWSRPDHPASSTTSVSELAATIAEVVQFVVHNPERLRRLHAATSDVARHAALEETVSTMLDAGIALAGSELGSLQLLDPATSSLHLVAWCGFDGGYIDHVSVVDDDNTTGGRAILDGRQVFVSNVAADDDHGTRSPTAGYRSVQSTPLRDYRGRMVGVFSTHWRDPGEQPMASLRVLQLYGDFAGERLGQLLMRREPPTDDVLSTMTRAVMDALLDPWSSWTNTDTDTDTDTVMAVRRPGQIEQELLSDPLAHLADVVVTGLFTALLEIDAAQSLAVDEPTAGRLQMASQTLTALLLDVREALLGRT